MNPQKKSKSNPEETPKRHPNQNLNEAPLESLKKPSRNPHERFKYQNVANTIQMRG